MKLSPSLLLILSFLSSSIFAQNFVESGTSTPFLKMNFNASLSHFEDFNLDGKLDIIQSGTMTVGSPNLVIYMNMGDDVFDLSPIINEKDSLSINNFLVSNFDADQFPDILINGFGFNGNPFLKMLTNDGSGHFDLNTSFDISPLSESHLVKVDLNADNSADFIIIGKDSTGKAKTNAYLNDRNGNFSIVTNIGLEDIYNGDISASDIDKDGDEDLLICGTNNDGQVISNLFMNNGVGVFTKDTITFLELFNYNFAKIVDLNGDNLLDIFVSGIPRRLAFNGEPETQTQVFLNKGSGKFETVNTTLHRFSSGTLSLVDIDNDNDIDLYISGYLGHWNGNIHYVNSFFLNDGEAHFTEGKSFPIASRTKTYVSFGDYDLDGDEDLFFTSSSSETKLYTNIGCANNYYTDTQTSCDSYKWIDGKEYANSTNTASHIIKREMSCDSVILLDLTINYSDTYTNTVNATGEFTWIDGNTYYESNNTATYTLTNQSGCDSTVSLNLTLIPLANELESTVTLFPNPSGEQIKFDLGHEPEENIKYQIFNTSGIELKTWENNLKEQVIDIRPLPSGTYIIKYQEGIKSQSLKFVKR